MRPNVLAQRCASRAYMAMLADKWSLLVLNALGEGPRRNGELMRAVEGISQKMLTQTLRSLEALHIVERRDFQTIPPHVTYALTPLGQSLRREAIALIRWVESHVPELAGQAERG
jgi:DNA-binding HxlR family transcriptional regulator